EVQKPDVYSKPDTTICAGDSFVWDCGLAGAYTYTWSTGESSRAITIDQAGTYWVDVEDMGGNIVTSDTVSVSVSTFADDATLGADTSLCEGNKLELIEGKADAVDYLWSTGNTQSQLDITAGGEYSLIVKDIYGCTLYDTIQVDFKGIAPVVTIDVADQCINESTRYENTTVPSDGSSVSATDWIFGVDTLHGFVANRPNSAAGNLSLRVITHTDVGCLGVLDTTITIGSLPQSNFSPPRACTHNITEFMNTGSVEYDFIENSIWEIDGEYFSGNTLEYEFDTAGIYPVSLQSISNYGCTHDTIIDIEVRPSADIQFSYGKTCQGERMHFFDKTEYEPHNTAVDGHWYVNSVQYPQYKTFGITFNNPDTYVIGLEVTTINGCTGYTADTITIFNAPQFDSLRIYGCNNQEITLNEHTQTFGQDIVSYTWNIDSLGIRSEPEPIVVFKETGNYNFTLEVETDKGCIGEAPGTIFVEEPPTADFEFFPEFGAVPLEVDLTNTSSGAVDYEWLFEGYYESTEVNPTHEFTMRDTSYARLIARSQYGCVDTITYHIPVDLADQHIELLDIRYHENEQGFLEYTISVANTGNTVVHMIEFIIENPDYPHISETWEGELIPGDLLEYTCSARLQKTNDKVPAYFCITGNLISQDVYRVYDSDTLCKDFTRQFSLYSIAPSPATEDVISVSFGVNTPGDCTIEFFDATGQICIKKTFHNLSPGVYKKEINMYKLHSGIYTVTLSQDNKQEVRAISVIK
ncbi:MAG: T9SS type A sorting domain-containing protein, partial [Bacteroidales bacterium]